MFQRSRQALINYARLHNRKAARKYSAEYGKVWTKEIIPRTEQDIQLYGWFHNYPYHNQNDLTWWADRRRPRHTIANYALMSSSCSIFASLLRSQETAVLHQLSIGGGTTLLLPTDAAFADSTVLTTLRSDREACKTFLLSHAITGEMSVRTLANRCRQSKSGSIGVKTLGGKTVPIRVVGSLETANREVLIGGGKVINHGIKCSNGVVFVLDSLVV